VLRANGWIRDAVIRQGSPISTRPPHCSLGSRGFAFGDGLHGCQHGWAQAWGAVGSGGRVRVGGRGALPTIVELANGKGLTEAASGLNELRGGVEAVP